MYKDIRNGYITLKTRLVVCDKWRWFTWFTFTFRWVLG